MASTLALPVITRCYIAPQCSQGQTMSLLSLKPSIVSGLRLRHSSFETSPRSRSRSYRPPSAVFDRGSGNNEDKKKFISKDQEPDQYWQTADEKDGKNPMSTVLPYIAIVGLLAPFAILAIAFVNGWIKAPIR